MKMAGLDPAIFTDEPAFCKKNIILPGVTYAFKENQDDY